MAECGVSNPDGLQGGWGELWDAGAGESVLEGQRGEVNKVDEVHVIGAYCGSVEQHCRVRGFRSQSDAGAQQKKQFQPSVKYSFSATLGKIKKSRDNDKPN